MSGLTCDCCGKEDYHAAVASSSLGAVSFSYCVVCAAMGAEPEGILKSMKKGGMFDYNCVFYKNGSYYDLDKNELQLIKLNSGEEFKTRQEVIDHWNSKKNETT